ncbi:MAG: hypothetical protein M1133_14140 [Armatimonadetes bacterium]|nr:hypothetical protein [Armatimonadota bacterium]
MNDQADKSERNWVLAWAIAVVLLASTPYLVGVRITPQGYHFLGLTHNIDDGAVYISWMRQAADGHFFIRNLFTNEPQTARQFNVLMLAMGNFARVTHLPLIWVFHIFRMLLGVGLILAIWRFSGLFLDNSDQRRILIPLVGLSAGIGWLIPNVRMPVGSVDIWQPEAITFLAIYLNPLFLAGLILMVGSLYFLILMQRAETMQHIEPNRSMRPSRELRYAICAGMSMFLLGNIHTYDVITVACVWISYLLVLWIMERRFPARAVLLSILAAAIASPTIVYTFYLLRIDEVFRARANTPTPSPAIWSFFEGYGIILLGAVVGAVYSVILARREPHPPFPNSTFIIQNSKLLLLVWSVVGFVIPYIPVAQQRKLIMGLHIPLCILCAYGLTHLLSRAPRSVARGLILAFILFSMGSNVRFLSHDVNLLRMGETAPHFPAFISTSELAAMRYIRDHTKPSDTIFAPPAFSLFTPGLTGRQVYYGHWSETPEYGEKILEWSTFVDPSISSKTKAIILRSTGASYYVSIVPETQPPTDFDGQLMALAFSADNVNVYHINMPTSTISP